MTDQPTTYRAYTARLNNAGWSSEGNGLWTHGETGAKFYPWTSVRHDDGRMVELWRVMADWDALPDPEKEVIRDYE